MMIVRCAFGLLICFAGAMRAAAADIVNKSAAARWSPSGKGGVPDFTHHVQPLLGKMGCSNRACHGSFQGQNGFRLSLFAFDAKLDHAELTVDEGDGPRIDLETPVKSLLLTKPTGKEPHDGGIRMKTGEWKYRLLLSWIKNGAKYSAKKVVKITSLELRPREIRLKKGSSQRQPLKAIARFADGSREDVTPLTNFRTNDESITAVSEAGEVTAVGATGDTSIVATYGGIVVTSQVIVPVPGVRKPFPSFPANNKVDEFVLAKLKKVNVRPSELARDEVFLRRVYLDVIGTLPTAAEVRAFLADSNPKKRAALIDQLLDRPEYDMYWATKFSDWTGNDNRFTPQPRAKTAWLWHNWLRDKLRRNVPYEEIAGGFITASTREGRPIKEVAAEYVKVRDSLRKGFGDGTYAKRKTNDMFWQKAGNNSPINSGLQISYAFLGVRLECAQCHKHPFDRWTQDDFRSYTAIFAGLGRKVRKDVPKAIQKTKSRQDFRYREIYMDASPAAIRKRKGQRPRILGGAPIAIDKGQDPRVALWEWMRAPDNPFFAKAIVNRIWAHYLGTGIVNPVDDANAANPPSNPQLHDWLARDFITHKFDLKHLHRRILNSRTYQLSWVPNDSNRLDERNFSHALLRRMPAEVVLDAINQITGGSDRYSKSNAPKNVRTINLAPTRLRGGGPEYVLGIFGRPLRTQKCDCERGGETALAQAMYLLNDTDVNRKINDAKGRLAKLLKKIPNDRKLIEELYLMTLSRFPAKVEIEKSLGFIKQSRNRNEGMQDVLWSLLNVREFVFVH